MHTAFPETPFPNAEHLKAPHVQEAKKLIDSSLHPSNTFLEDPSASHAALREHMAKATPAETHSLWQYLVAKTRVLHDYAVAAEKTGAGALKKWAKEFKESKFAQWSERFMGKVWLDIKGTIKKITVVAEKGVHALEEGLRALQRDIKTFFATLEKNEEAIEENADVWAM